ncbi:hypothetical protein [Flavihumibacter petaseus]|uniref:Outer membrane protein beta-barrel domain-containing protein n=1 Tax=Flavihumibacter petaseus NBRC 106054 TaxID=1220578 RepID=A0A0E9MXW4_9BACT|nr:hypothetical protein [Flavihumibacter petaseus]GAO41965.1 hypothetical protein FPE01S_01_09780 [Flavihumibacter petaseus NBRC 106054]
MKKLILPLLCLMAGIPAFSQKNFVPGYIINQQGDTLRGDVNDQGWSRSPRKIEFQAGGSITQYEIAELKGFGMTNGDVYVREIVTRSTRPVEYDQLRQSYSDTTVTDTLLLRQVVRGQWNLYAGYVDKLLLYYQVGNEPLTELSYVVALDDNASGIYYRNYFRDQLNARLVTAGKQNDQLERKLSSLDYRESSMKRFFELLNGENGGNGNQLVQDKIKLTRFFGGIGMVANSLALEADDVEAIRELDNIKGSVSYSVQAGVEIGSARKLQRWVLRAEIMYYNFNASGSGETEKDLLGHTSQYDYSLKMANVRPSLSLLYHIVRQPAFRAYLGGGYSMNLSSYKENKMVRYRQDNDYTSVKDPFLDFEKAWGQLLLRGGVQVLDRYMIDLNYGVLGSFSSYPAITVKPRILNLQVNYRF